MIHGLEDLVERLIPRKNRYERGKKEDTKRKKIGRRKLKKKKRY